MNFAKNDAMKNHISLKAVNKLSTHASTFYVVLLILFQNSMQKISINFFLSNCHSSENRHNGSHAVNVHVKF
jgi:hypothetical protein